MRIAIIGATGLVGSVMMKVLEERNFKTTEIIPAASEKSIGKNISFRGDKCTIQSLDKALKAKPHIALFSAGSDVSRTWAPKFAQQGTYVIDNSSCWRLAEKVKLVVPEINGHLIDKNDYIIANPNCSTIQLVMVLHPLHLAYSLKRVVVSTYQSVTGTGAKALAQLMNERAGLDGENAYPHRIDLNAIPHCDIFVEDGYTREEIKIVNETRKILDDYSLKITSTAVRVPVIGGHSESVNISFEKDFDLKSIMELFENRPGINLLDNPEECNYPMPILAQGNDSVFVGRIRRDFSWPNSLNLWIVSDNLRKGAATNAVQIAEQLIKNRLIG